jgi:thioredoxin-like negative regulator of GroEL
VRRTAERWAAVTPDDDTPYREWGDAALARRDRAEARRAYLAGRERIKRPDALAPELAQLLAIEGDWPAALREWLAATARIGAYRSTAAGMLGAAPEPARPALLKQLADDGSPNARQLEAQLRARWGDPVGGFQALAPTLGGDPAGAAEALRGFLDQARGLAGPGAKRAEALALEALAQRVAGPEGSKLRLQAAQAFADAGDQSSARRMLHGVATDSGAAQGVASGATTTLVGVLLSEGKVDEAERKLDELKGSLASEDWLALRRRVAWGWVRRGRLGRADSIAAPDTSAEGLALAGRLRLLHGDLKGASERLAAAGPYAGSREDASERTALLALLQPIEADSMPPLGAALLKAEQGDTAGAIAGLEQAAASLPPGKGGAELRLHAGSLARAAGRPADAERLFRAADVAEAKAAAPAAELALGRLLLDLNRGEEAVKVLEQLILTHPESALVPQARRALDEARGAVPPT